jgi:uncharacterized protein (TIGR02118 family)
VIRLLILLKRRDGLAADAFESHLRGTHLPLVRRLPAIRKVAAHRLLPGPDGIAPAWDYVAEDWFETVEALAAALRSPEGRAVNADAATFVDLTKLQFLVLDQQENGA